MKWYWKSETKQTLKDAFKTDRDYENGFHMSIYSFKHVYDRLYVYMTNWFDV